MCTSNPIEEGEKRWGEIGGPGPKLVLSGYTEDGKPVVDFFHIVETYGVSLTTVLDSFYKEGITPDWVGFIRASFDKDWKIESTKIKLETAILDVYGKEYLIEWQRRWRKLFKE